MGQEVKNSRSQEVEEPGAAVVSLHRSQILSFPTRSEFVASVRRLAGRDFCGSGRQKPGLEGQKTMTAEVIAQPKEGGIVNS